MIKRISFILLAIIFIGLTYIRLFPFNFRPEWDPTVPVVVSSVESWNVQDTINTFATSESLLAVDLTASVSERVEALYFEEGDRVEKGALLAVLEHSEQQAAYDEAQKKAERVQKLVADDVLPEKDLEDAIRSRDVLKAQLDRYFIRAPFSGIVGAREVEKGALVSPGTLITSIDQFDTMKVAFAIPEKYAASLSKGQFLLFKTLNADPVEGKTTFASSRIDAQTRTVAVKGIIENTDQNILPGMSGKVRLLLSQREGVVIPEEALVSSEAATFVYIVKDNKAVRVDVVIGKRFNGAVEITSGLEAGQVLITEGMLKLRPDNPVEIVEEQEFDFDAIQSQF